MSTDVSSYKKLTPREHILVRPDSYIGSRVALETQRWIWNPTEGRMNWKTVQYNPGLYKIFDEVLVNALDHKTRQRDAAERQQRVSRITVTLTPTMFRIQNDGAGISSEIHPEYKVMAPELIFGHLLTSSNYDDSEEKVVGGKNGYGAKLTNIYSNRFTVRTCEIKDGKRTLYTQVFTDNMATIGKPTIIKPPIGTKPFTEITSEPDLLRFYPEMEEPQVIPMDMLDVLRTRVVDAAALAAADGVKVYLSESDTDSVGIQIPVTSFESYARLFAEPKVPVFYENCGPRWEIAAILTRDLHAESLPDDRHISFVNGIFTRRGGKHVDAVTRAVFTAFCEGPGKKLDLKPAQLKDAVTFFVNATIVNPDFESQSKETLTTIASRFGSKPVISNKFIENLAKEGLSEEASLILKGRQLRDAKKADGHKIATVRGIPKLEDATWAGTAKSEQCSLILTEGDSAAALAIAGLAVVGRERFGVFPLRGKGLNIRSATLKEKTDNKELTYLKQILGLVQGRKYTDTKSLRYGSIMIMTDQDVDGSHIKGLIINMFEEDWPELLQIPIHIPDRPHVKSFLTCLMTPLLKATNSKRKLVRQFYSEPEYKEWLETSDEANGGTGWIIKYYKGLGTSTAAEGRDYFKSMNLVSYGWDDSSHESIDLVFNKKRSDDRKEWLETFDPKCTLIVPPGGATFSYTDFINKELIHFSVETNERAIPHMMDGLKPSLRKVLYAARKRNLTSEIKVAQLAGYVSEHSAYHHGEKSLMDAIIGMAQNFIGSNNINLLEPNGQFGTRLEGGSDSAAPRYIFTALEKIQSYIFCKTDDATLKWRTDDGVTVEPEYYLPIIPMLLVNGSNGIGTGYSATWYPHSPEQLIGHLRERLQGKIADLSTLTLKPWWDGFKGTVTFNPKKTNVTATGVFDFFDDDGHRVKITELPPEMWTTTYKTFLENIISPSEKTKEKEKLKSKTGTKVKAIGGAGIDSASTVSSSSIRSKSELSKTLLSFESNYNDTSVEFILTLDPEYYYEAKTFPSEFAKKFHLTKSFSLTNLVAFNTDGVLRRFETSSEYFESYYGIRLQGYLARKEAVLARLKDEITETEARVTFVKAVVDGTLVVSNADDDELLEGLIRIGVPPLSLGEGLRGFEYLLRMRVDRLKASAVLELERELAKLIEQRDSLMAKTPEILWLEDLDELSVAYGVHKANRVAQRNAADEASAVAAAETVIRKVRAKAATTARIKEEASSKVKAKSKTKA